MNIAKKKHSCGSVALTTNVFIAQTPSWDVICFPSKKKSTRLAMLRTSKCPIPPHFQVVFKLIAGGGQNDRFNRFSKNKTSKYKRQFPK